MLRERSEDEADEVEFAAALAEGPQGIEAKAEELLSPSKRRSRLPSSRQMREAADKAFNEIDANGDGVITRQEFEDAVASRSFSLRGLTSSDEDM